MNINQYSKQVLETESPIDTALVTRAAQNSSLRLMHAALGLTTETGEFVDAIKKHIFYGKPLDRANLLEELGDLFWYASIAADELGVDLDKILTANLLKLKSRYPAGYSHSKAISRDTAAESTLLNNLINEEQAIK